MNMTWPNRQWVGKRVKCIHNLDREGVVVGYNDECVIIDYDDLTPPEHEPYENLIIVDSAKALE